MKTHIPIFFATDDKYAPFLSVTLKSLLKNASKKYFYEIIVLKTNLSKDIEKKLKKCSTLNSSISFISLQNELSKIYDKLHLRDYYSKETYYRFFIANLFPQYDKVLYLDCDIVVLGDISELYNTELGNNLLGAVPEEVMNTIDVFGEYVEKTLDVSRKQYFNAGILLMNTKAMREINIEKIFVDLLSKFTFTVTQDQDYLNIICKNRTTLLNLGWNKTSYYNPNFNEKDLRIIHYKIHWKPWHYEGVMYEDYFWKYAQKTIFYKDLIKMRNNYTEFEKQRDKLAYEKLIDRAIKDANNPNNYKNTKLKEIC